MNSRKRPLTDTELWNAIYEDSSEDEPDNEIQSEEEDFVISDEFEDDEMECESSTGNNSGAEPSCEEISERRPRFFGRNGYVWHATPFHSKFTRTSKKNLVIHLPGPKGNAKNINEIKDLWEIFFNDTMIDIIVENTNKEISLQKENFSTKQSYIHDVTKNEILATIGLLYFAGVLKNAHLSLEEMWSNKFGIPIFRNTMSKNRFEFILNCLRFDNKETRLERRSKDKFAPIRDIWEMFIQACKENYTPGEYVTIDEQLMSFRGRCPFKIYMPMKPDKYGLKIVMMCDSNTSYMCNALPYLGKESETENKNKGKSKSSQSKEFLIPTQDVLRLTETIHGTYRNVTVDNWFTSVELADQLSLKKLTVVGTLRKNKKEVPSSFLEGRRENIPSSAFAFTEDKTLVSFKPKKNKCVLLLSTMHDRDDVDEHSGKPEIVLFYNSTKGGVDTFDQLCHSKTVARKTQRWPLRIFYGMMDMAAINVFILYQLKNVNSKCSRAKFLKLLANALVETHMKERLKNKKLPRQLKNSIQEYLGYSEDLPPEKREKGTGRCYLCPRNRDRKGRHICIRCGKNLCAEHCHDICEECK